MGIDYTTYIGPYIRCEFHNVETTETLFCCPNASCNEYNKEVHSVAKTPFCSKCGTKILGKEFPVTEPSVDVWKVYESIDEALYSPLGNSLSKWQKDVKLHIWMPNRQLNCNYPCKYPLIHFKFCLHH